jgi:hypothetical protein
MHSKEALSVEDAFYQGKQKDPWPTEDCTSVFHVLEGIEQCAHATEATWRYGIPQYPGPPPPESIESSNRRRLPHSWRSEGTSFGEICSLLQSGCLVLTFNFVSSAWDNPGGVIDAARGEDIDDGHAILAVGTASIGSETVIVVKNSWGEDWGDGGYGYVTASYIDNYLLETYAFGSAA